MEEDGKEQNTRGWGGKASFGRTVHGNVSLVGLARKTLPPANSAWWPHVGDAIYTVPSPRYGVIRSDAPICKVRVVT